jgi:hypothetical protein
LLTYSHYSTSLRTKEEPALRFESIQDITLFGHQGKCTVLLSLVEIDVSLTNEKIRLHAMALQLGDISRCTVDAYYVKLSDKNPARTLCTCRADKINDFYDSSIKYCTLQGESSAD